MSGDTGSRRLLEAEPPEARIARAVACLRENHAHGWHEIAGTGGFAACLRDGRIATRIGGAAEHHDTPHDAGVRLARAAGLTRVKGAGLTGRGPAPTGGN
jgi:hypothetical protein